MRAGLRDNDVLSCKMSDIVADVLLDGSEVIKYLASRTPLERGTKEGNSPVREGEVSSLLLFSSRAGPEKSRLKLGPL